MESVHGVDVSWMSKHTSNGNNTKGMFIQDRIGAGIGSSTTHHLRAQVLTDHFADARPVLSRKSSSPPSEKVTKAPNGTSTEQQPTAPKPIPIRPSYGRTASSERPPSQNGSTVPKSVSPSPGRRNSWLSSISSKFSSSNPTHPSHIHNAPTTPPAQASPSIPEEVFVPTGPSAPKNAILPHAVKPQGDVPYTPAPPKSSQPNFLQSALRRLSSSGGQLPSPGKGLQHGICERKVLNVDKNRERCRILELDQSKLRRVAFCVDVEIASSPRYFDDDSPREKSKEVKKEMKRVVEKGEAEALKNPDAVKEDKEADGVITAAGENTGEMLSTTNGTDGIEVVTEPNENNISGEKDSSKKKEKKKRSEEERKARKEKKRKLAEANGTLPVELVRDANDSSGPSTPGSLRSQASPTTDPVRIYRRCCQLRETPILKRITEQLASANQSSVPGLVSKLDLTGYWLQLPDLVTLGDYLAVVPVKELIMENCGLTDEGVRVILAGLLAAKCPDWERKRFKHQRSGEVPQGGFVERIVFKHNVNIGKDGWRYISTFIAMCRSLKSMDLSKVPFPQPVPASSTPTVEKNLHLTRTTSTTSSTADISCVLGKAIGERLAGREFELLNIAECGISTEQLGSVIDGVIKSGLRRLGLAGNTITPEGMQHVARYVREGKCEGLDLGGNDLKDQLPVIANALDDNNSLYALSLANCNLTPNSLWSLFPALAKLTNFRFIDLSQNHGLFDVEQSALSLLRRYVIFLLWS